MFKLFSEFKYFDTALLIATALLSIVGLALLYSTSVADGTTGVFWRQFIFLGLGLVCFFFFSFFDYHTLSKANKVFYVIFVILLIYLLVFGSNIRGGRRWIDLGFFRFQVAEFVKICVILGLSRLLYLRRGQINSWGNILWSFFYTVIPAVLVLVEPDLGSAIIIGSIWAGVILVSPIKKRFLIILFVSFLIVAGLSWKFALKDFQKDRVLIFLNPKLDPRGRGYNVRQAAIAVGSGQLWGRGLGKGLQSEHKFLPERQTDFIFAASSEEVGFFGMTALLIIFFTMFFRIVQIAQNARDDLGMYIAFGVFFMLFTHVTINISMNIGLLPVTGIPLPFISAGGSSLVVTLILLGIVQNIARQSKILRF